MAFKFVRSPRTEARWFEFQGAEFLIAPANNQHYMAALFEHIKYSDLASTNSEIDLLAKLFADMTTAEAHAVVARLAARAILLDWRGVEDEDGKPVPYEADTAAELLRLNHAAMSFVERKSHEVHRDAEAAVADVKKKSGK